MRVATATRPRTVIGIRADGQTGERPRRRVMRHSRQASPHSRPLPAGDSMITTYLVAADEDVWSGSEESALSAHQFSRRDLFAALCLQSCSALEVFSTERYSLCVASDSAVSNRCWRQADEAG